MFKYIENHRFHQFNVMQWRDENNTNSTYEASDRPYVDRRRPGMTENNFWSSQENRLAFIFYVVNVLYGNGFVESVCDACTKYSYKRPPSP